MSFKEVASLDADVTVALGKKDKAGKPYPKQAEGYYLGSRKVQNKRGESTLHFLQTAKGNLGVWGTTDLNRKLGQAKAGDMVRITSTGTKPTPNGDMYTYKVEVDTDNTIPVDFGIEVVATSDDEVDAGDAYAEEPAYEDEDVTAQLAADAAARRAKTQALFNSKGKSAK